MTKAISFICLAGAMVFLAAGALELFTHGSVSHDIIISWLSLLLLDTNMQILAIQAEQERQLQAAIKVTATLAAIAEAMPAEPPVPNS